MGRVSIYACFAAEPRDYHYNERDTYADLGCTPSHSDEFTPRIRWLRYINNELKSVMEIDSMKGRVVILRDDTLRINKPSG